MTTPKISKREWPVMQALWERGRLSIGEITNDLRGPDRRPTYETVQTMIYRLESRGAVRRVEKIRNFHIFQASVDRDTAEKQVVAELLRLFDGRVGPFSSI